jgi:outer membrane protein assembly factor BamB
MLAAATIVGTTACGTATPSPAGSAAASAPPTFAPAASPAASPTAPPVVVAGDWPGFRGDASRSGIGSAGLSGKPVMNWQFRARAGVPNNLAIVGDQVSFATDDMAAYALDRTTGAQRWVVDVGQALLGPVAADGRLYFTTSAGAAIALDPKDGHTLWTSPSRYDEPSQLVSDAGSLYFGTGDGFLVALDATSGVELWRLKPTPSTTRVDSPAAASGRIYAGTDGGGFVAVDAATHRVVWTGDTKGEDTGTASVAHGLAFIGASADTSSGGLRAFDAATGTLRWSGPIPLLQIPVVTDGLALSATSGGRIEALDLETGAARWSIQLTGKIRPMAVAGHTLYLSADQERRVYAVDIATGSKLWQFDVDASNDCCIAVAGGTVYVGTLGGSVYSIGGDGSTLAGEPSPTRSPSAAPASPTPAPTVADLAAKVSWSVALDQAAIAPISQIAIDPGGRIWVPQANAGRIAIFGADGTFVEEWGEPGSKAGQFDFTRSNGDGYGTLAFAKDGSFYVLDAGNRRIQQFDARRRFVAEWGGFGSRPGQYNDPVGIAVDPDGTVWVLDNIRSVIEHYDRTGTVLGSFDPFTSMPDNDGGNSLAIDAAGQLYVSGARPSQVFVFDAAGTLLRSVGAGIFTEQATHMAIGADGRLYVTQGPQRGERPGILVFEPDGTLVGGLGPLGTGPGAVVFPAGIALDARGGLIVEDSQPESARLIRYGLVPPTAP